MFLFLLLPLLAESRGEVPPGAVELTVYRSAAELPEQWRKQVPQNFDWSREMLATPGRPPQAVVMSPPPQRTQRLRGDLYLWKRTEPPEPMECPPCRGARMREDELIAERRAVKAPTIPLYRLARTTSRVFQAPDPEVLTVTGPGCPPCTAP